jgi:DtxR family transcriptional regulator, Mn-dependent transcriptional regulator
LNNHVTVNLTSKQQAYLETIDELCRCHGHAHAKAIADKLNVRMASVTEAMRSLATKGLINYQPHKSITLTPQGRIIAAELEKRHNALEEFFHQILGCSKSRSETIACQVEHVIDEQFRHRLSSFIEFINDKKTACGSDLIEDFKNSYNKPR